MARRVGADDIKKMNELYYICHNYAEVARQTGWSPSTVKSHIVPNFTPTASVCIKHFDKSIPDINFSMFAIENFGDLCVLSDEEKVEIEELRKELSI